MKLSGAKLEGSSVFGLCNTNNKIIDETSMIRVNEDYQLVN